MTLEEHSDREERGPNESTADGDAALLLVESLIHVLIERSVLTVPDALSAVQTAIEVTTEGTPLGGPEWTKSEVPDRLFRILDSLDADAHLAPRLSKSKPSSSLDRLNREI